MNPVLRVRDLSVAYDPTPERRPQVEGVHFELYPGETLGLAGQSGCGKSTIAAAIMGLLPSGASVSGEVLLENRNLIGLDEQSMTALRGRDVSMVFQNPMTALDPVFRVGWQLIRVIRRQRRLSAGEAGSLAQDILQRMSIPDPGRVLQAYPHELSGGMRQRVAIAMAMISRPRVLLADEPTTALDVTTQAGILGELDDLARSYGVSTLLISHDLGVIAATCDRCLVMQDGRIVESVAVDDLLSSPHHPHAVELVRCSTPGVGAEGNVQ